MNTETIVYCVVALILGMLMANMLKNVCGCKTVEGQLAVSCCKNIKDEAECHAAWPHCDWTGDVCQRPNLVVDIVDQIITGHQVDPNHRNTMEDYLESAILRSNCGSPN